MGGASRQLFVVGRVRCSPYRRRMHEEGQCRDQTYQSIDTMELVAHWMFDIHILSFALALTREAKDEPTMGQLADLGSLWNRMPEIAATCHISSCKSILHRPNLCSPNRDLTAASRAVPTPSCLHGCANGCGSRHSTVRWGRRRHQELLDFRGETVSHHASAGDAFV